MPELLRPIGPAADCCAGLHAVVEHATEPADIAIQPRLSAGSLAAVAETADGGAKI
jgi:hypothetical protein